MLYRFFPALAPPVPDTEPFTKRGWYEGARSFPQEPFQYTEGLAESTRHDHALETQDERAESLLVDLAAVLNGLHPRVPDAWRPNLPAGDKVLISVLRAQHNKSILLLRIAEVYPGFTPPPYAVDDRDGGDAPVRPRRLRDVRYTFGDPNRTMPLLLVHIREELVGIDVGRIVPYIEGATARDVLWMYRAFGLLAMRYVVLTSAGATRFASIRRTRWYLMSVRSSRLSTGLCRSGACVRSDRRTNRYKRWDPHQGRRKTGRWKW